MDMLLAKFAVFELKSEVHRGDYSLMELEKFPLESAQYKIRDALVKNQFPRSCDRLLSEVFMTTGMGFSLQVLELGMMRLILIKGLSYGIIRGKSYQSYLPEKDNWSYLGLPFLFSFS